MASGRPPLQFLSVFLNPNAWLATLTFESIHLFMNFELPSDALGLLNLEPWSIAIIIPVAGLIFAGVIIVTTFYFKHRQRELWHQTARLALEKGQPLPPWPQEETADRSSRGESAGDDLRAGLICLAAGIGIYLFLGNFISHSLGYVGAIPGFVGVALLISGVVRLLVGRKHHQPASGSSRLE